MRATDMRILGVERILLFLLLSLSGFAVAKDLSMYPCTVFSADACFRLPTGTHVDYSIPADFDLYKVSKDTEPVATIYIGNAPQKVKGSAPSSVSESTGRVITVYRNEAAPIETLDIYITPKTKGVSTVHISAGLNASTRNELIELLSSLRPCKPIKSGGQKCPLNADWGKELTKAIKGTETVKPLP